MIANLCNTTGNILYATSPLPVSGNYGAAQKASGCPSGYLAESFIEKRK